MTLIGLGYKARQGKTYVANYMKEALPSIQLYAFADELKLYCKEHHDELLPRWQLAHQTKQIPSSKSDPIYGFTPILQWYGTDVARKADPDTWVKALAERLETEKPDIAVITDVRFPNEAQFIRERGGYLVEVYRRNEDGSQFIDPTRDPNHPSETALNDYDFDFIISERDGNLAGLKSKAQGVLSILLDKDKYAIFDELNAEYDVSRFHPDDDGTGFYE